jgi:hypothetical protein
MVGWYVHPKQLLAQPLLKDKCLSIFFLAFMIQIVVHELCVFENDLYVFVMKFLSCLHVYFSILYMHQCNGSEH